MLPEVHGVGWEVAGESGTKRGSRMKNCGGLDGENPAQFKRLGWSLQPCVGAGTSMPGREQRVWEP